MIITADFVMINYPKTGSTFVRNVIKEVYDRRVEKNIFRKFLIDKGLVTNDYQELFLPHHHIPNYKDQHGGYYQIPSKDKAKRIVSVLRNPYERFKSVYNFRWWVKNPMLNEKLLLDHFPHFPNLSMDDYVDYHKILNQETKEQYGIPSQYQIGNHTILFILLFARQPREIFLNLPNLAFSDIEKEIVNIHFLEQQNLNDDLIDFLSQFNFSKSDLQFIKYKKKENVSSTNSELTQKAIEYISTNENLLLEILKSRNFYYSPPQK